MGHNIGHTSTERRHDLSPLQATLIALFTRALVGDVDGELDKIFAKLVNNSPVLPTLDTTASAPEPYQVTIAEAARRLSMSYRHMCRLIELGEVPAIGSGRGRRVALADLRVWQDRNRVWEGGK